MDCRLSALLPLAALGLVLTLPALVSGCEDMYKELSVNHSMCMPDPAGVHVQVIGLSPEEKQAIVDLHNDYRSNIHPPAADMMMMRWDTNLARIAKARARSCTGNHEANMKERMVPGWIRVKIGQNIGINHRSWNSTLDRFWTEHSRYNYFYGYGTDDPNAAKYPDGAGHFFQMAFAKTTRVGCAIVQCTRDDKKSIYRYCNYAPAMNSAVNPYEEGEPCSKCPAQCDGNKNELATFPKLCDCGNKICFNGGILDPATCNCECNGMYTGNRCEQIDCKMNDHDNCKGQNPADCGKKGYVEDINMCPHLCDVCQECQHVTKCANGGTMMYNNCTCACPEGYSGKSCETKELPLCPEMDIPDCNVYYNKSQCVYGDAWYSQTAPTAFRCPVLCQSCKFPADGSCSTFPCKNGGMLNTVTCKCQCKDGYSGPHCGTCPTGNDPLECPFLMDNIYQTDPNFMHFYCPQMAATLLTDRYGGAPNDPSLAFPQCDP